MSNQHKAKKKFGQNFLISEKTINEIINAVDYSFPVLEIGPGKGALTNKLSKQASSVVAFEIDRDLTPILQDKFENTNVEIFEKDFLEFDLNELNDKYVVVANLPYYITSDIIFKLIESYEKFEQITIMVQFEVAERILAQPNSSDYSKLSVSLQTLYDVQPITFVPASHFSPAPKVNSAVVQLNKIEIPTDFEIHKYLNFVKDCFQFRRKTLWNNLKEKMTSQDFDQFCKDYDFSLNIRPQQLEVGDYLNLFELIKNKY